MDSTKVSRATKDSCYFIVNSKGQALARRAKYAQFYFTQIRSNEIERWRDKNAAKEGLIFYQKNAERFSLSNDEMQKCKIMKAIVIETITESVVIEDADDVGSSRQ